jgi:phosphopantothenoylcysteine synthetase/decarboxylase
MAKPKIILGVTGSIAAYKAGDLVRMMGKQGWDVWVVMTTCAKQYIGPLPLQALTGNPVMHGTFAEKEQDTYSHLTLSDDAAAMVVAPCSAQTLARLAYGFADDVLAATALALQAPLLVAPAMNTRMWLHPAVQENAAILTKRGVTIVGPGEGALACGTTGPGRLADLDVIVAAVARAIRSA